MKTKQQIAFALIISMFFMNFLPMTAFAFNEKKLQTKTKKELKIENAYKARLNYINIGWWNEYNDQYLQDYIKRAFENNQDLKIATLKVEESRQGTKLQLACELPNFTVGVSRSEERRV